MKRIRPAGRRLAAGARSRALLCGASLSVVALLGLPTAAQAQQDRWWDPNGSGAGSGGNGDWNTSSASWSASNSEVLGPWSAWDNAAIDNAIFGTTVGTLPAPVTVTVAEAITVHDMTFQSVTPWTLNGSPLTLAGTTPEISTATGVTATINSIIDGQRRPDQDWCRNAQSQRQ
jgi:fibronectin-binding autotransporter adhesin